MTIEERMTRVERQVRRMKWAVLLLSVALVVGIGWQSRVWSPGLAHGQNPRVVEAEEFRVVDENGKVRAVLGGSKGGPSLNLYDENGKIRVRLVMDKGGTGLAFRDENGKLRAGLGLSHGASGLYLYDENGKPRVGLSVDKDGVALRLSDENGKVRAGLAVLKDEPVLALYDENETGRAVLGSTSLEAVRTGTVEKRAPSSLVLFDKDGNVIFKAP